jgi:hypothetical protein
MKQDQSLIVEIGGQFPEAILCASKSLEARIFLEPAGPSKKEDRDL